MSQVQQVKAATDVIQVIGERIQLTASGSNYRALCPFHSETTPSFFVSPVLQRYRCFGCGEQGDAFSFLEKYEGMSFHEALQYLAKQAGIELSEYQATGADEERQRILGILDVTRAYYHYLLTEHAVGESAREYLKQRGVTQESIKLFQMGFALPSWDGLIKYLCDKKKYQMGDLEKAGLVIKGRGDRYYDRFRGRIMFPLTNHRGQVVGFSGRVLQADAKEAKYINSPETATYHKSELLFGFSQLYQFIRKEEEVIIVEGELDVVSSTQAHVNNVVAIKGSALTKDQLQLLSRTVKKILLSLDMDSAGIEATKRGIALAKEFNLELRVIQLPADAESGKAKDPDELARQDPAAWRAATKQSISVYEFFLQRALIDHDASTAEGKRQIIDDLAPVFNQISHEVEKEVYLRKLATALEIREELVRRDLSTFGQPKLNPRRAANAAQSNESSSKSTQQLSRRHKLEQFLFFLLMRLPAGQLSAQLTSLDGIEFDQPELRAIFTQLATTIAEDSNFDLNTFVRELAEDLQQALSLIMLQPEYMSLSEDVDVLEEWRHTVRDLKQIVITERIAAISQELSQLDSDQTAATSADTAARQQALLQEIVTLQQKVKN
jgi:DNA primase